MFDPLRNRSRVFTELPDVLDRLERIQLRIDWVNEAARQGNLQRLLSTEFDFPGHAEYTAASRSLRTLAEIACEAWTRQTFLGIPVVMSHDGTIAIAVTAGDYNSGINGDDDPRTRSLKGPNTVRAINRPRLPLGDGEYDAEIGVEFWYMLTYATADGVRVEVALPDHGQGENYVNRWRERIIVGDVGGHSPAGRRETEPIPSAPPVHVSRKLAS